MKTLAAVPMKDLWAAKSRLAPRLDSLQRKRVALELFARGQLFLSRDFPLLDRLVVTPCPLVSAVAREYGAAVITEPVASRTSLIAGQPTQAGLNAAASLALNYARSTGCEWLLLLPGDLPYLLASEFEELLSMRRSGRATVVPSKDGGTNALLLPVPELPPNWSFAYGTRSAPRHAGLLEAAGLSVTTLCLCALAHDVDTVEDEERLRAYCEGKLNATPGIWNNTIEPVTALNLGPFEKRSPCQKGAVQPDAETKESHARSA